MGVAEKVQAEALDFVEYLIAKAEHEEAKTWNERSLSSAMRGIEDETSPIYEISDLKESFR